MDTIHHPTKEQVRDWIYHRQLDHKPLPDMAQIRHELGWDVTEIVRNDVSGGTRHS